MTGRVLTTDLKIHRWTEEDIKFLKENYADASWEVLMSHFNVSKYALLAEASKLGARRNKARFSNYTKDEEDLIKKLYGKISISDIVSNYLPYRTESSVRLKAEKLGCKTKVRWTNEEKEWLKVNSQTLSIDDIAKALGRTKDSVICHAQINGIKLIRERKTYSPEEDLFLYNNYLSLSNAEMAQALARSVGSVKERRRKLGILKPRAIGYYSNIAEFVRKNNKQWKKDSIKNCNFKCVVTGKRFDDVHHLYGLNMILSKALDAAGIDKNIDINTATDDEKKEIINAFVSEQSKYPLGVCLTTDLHNEFHRIYGFGDNTPDQFYEFVKTVSPDCKFLIA